MKKKLVIRFVKFEKALVAQQLAIVGDEHFNETEHVKLDGSFYLCESLLSLINSATDDRVKINALYFSNNAERDEYLDKVVKWISEEQFATSGKLKVGEMCDVSDDNKYWYTRKLLAVLPKTYSSKYIVASKYDIIQWVSYKYARPIASCVWPKIDGDVYTWEMEVAE